MDIQSRLVHLGQIAPADTNAHALIAATAQKVIVTSIIVANVTNANKNFYIYLDQTGAGALNANAIAFDVQINADSYTVIEFAQGLPLIPPDGQLLIKSSSANDLTFTAVGVLAQA